MRLLILLTLFTLSSCSKLLPDEPAANEVLDGTIADLTTEEEIQFGKGDEGFARVFMADDGLGPLFVETSCISCHIGDGRGHPFSELFRFSHIDDLGNLSDLEHLGGPQLQHRSTVGYPFEQVPSQANGVTSLLAPPSTGLGFLEAVADEDLIALTDPDDSDGDGISGRLSYVSPPSFFRPFDFNKPNEKGQYIGRFGRKSGAINLLIQTTGAYRQDMGVTSEFEPEEPQGTTIAPHDPDISTEEVLDVVFYLQTLKAPERRNEEDADVIAGSNVFSQINCNKCHTPSMQTTDFFIAGLSNKLFHPYTDLLLHDMGAELDDNYTEAAATTAEWRTTPLWGLGLASDAQGGNLFLMHDGRAKSIDEAIQLHGGEGSNSRTGYNALSQSDKDLLITFLESL